MVRGMLLSLCRHRWWYPVGHDGVGSEQSPLQPALQVSSQVVKTSDFRVRDQGPSLVLHLLGYVTLGGLL